jgi:hypothetical protein
MARGLSKACSRLSVGHSVGLRAILMGPEGLVPPFGGIPLVDAYGGPRDGLECLGLVGLGPTAYFRLSEGCLAGLGSVQ